MRVPSPCGNRWHLTAGERSILGSSERYEQQSLFLEFRAIFLSQVLVPKMQGACILRGKVSSLGGVSFSFHWATEESDLHC